VQNRDKAMILKDICCVGFDGNTLLARHVSTVHRVGEENCWAAKSLKNNGHNEEGR
jgi:hypothetical protein